MHELIEETFNVVETNMPRVDCTESRHRFRSDRRKAWQKPQLISLNEKIAPHTEILDGRSVLDALCSGY